MKKIETLAYFVVLLSPFPILVAYGSPSSNSVGGLGRNDEETRIQTGTPISPLPFMAALVGVTQLFGLIPISYAGARCGGSLIDNRTILTAAHCFTDEDKGKSFQALLGISDVSTGSYYKNLFSRTAFFLDFSYDDITFHPNWTGSGSGGNYNNDLAIITLKKSIDLGCSKLKPICLAERDYTDNLRVIGWGLQDCETKSSVLRMAVGNYVEQDKCKKLWSNVTEIQSSQYCSLFVDNNGEDAAVATGDSGGPLFRVRENDDPVQVGIASFGAFHQPHTEEHPPWCAMKHMPQVFTRLSVYKEFIQAHSNAVFC